MNHTARGNAAFTRDASGFRLNAHAWWHIHSRTFTAAVRRLVLPDYVQDYH
jgi:hypothetical protein